MSRFHAGQSRRSVLASMAALGTVGPVTTAPSAATEPILTRPIPSSGEPVPAIGMGTWITFDVGDLQDLRDHRARILEVFFARGGAVIDSSPMYGSSEAVVGHGLAKLGHPEGLFAASKIWTPIGWTGPLQMQESRELWGVEQFDLMQVHNLLNWEAHLETLREAKAEGSVRYVGITTSHGRRHDAFERIMTSEPLDAVQLTYNILDREAEQRLLPLAAERGLAVIANRPFRRKQLFDLFAHHPLPDFAAEIDCANWAQFFLKFIVSHPAVTSAIPATSQIPHMEENMGALTGRLPDAELRARMVRHVESL